MNTCLFFFFLLQSWEIFFKRLSWNPDHLHQNYKLQKMDPHSVMQQQLEVKNSSDEDFEDVNLVFWCLWNGCFPNASHWGIFSLSEEKTRWPLMQVTFNLSLCVWMNCLYTIKSIWLIVSASALFIQRVQTKQICSCMCVFERMRVCACIHTCTSMCVCGQTSCRGPLAEPQG